MFDVTGRVQTCLYPLDSDNVNSLKPPPLHLEVCNECCLFLASEMDERLIELLWKCEELYDMSNKNYSDRVWKGKL
jgi:hypothetical protein